MGFSIETDKVLHRIILENNLAFTNFSITIDLLLKYCRYYGKFDTMKHREKGLALKLAALSFLKYKNSYIHASKIPEGFVYIISNPAWPNACKIGKAFDTKRRLKQFQVSCPYRDYKIEHYDFKENALVEENRLHNLFSEYRLEGEWFSISPNIVLKQLKGV